MIESHYPDSASDEPLQPPSLNPAVLPHRNDDGAMVYAISLPEHLIDPDAVKVVRRLRRAGHLAYLVGGCVRDLLLGETPKDFDVTTSARPNQVRDLFRNCRIIGRRFRLAHVLFSGGKIIEVATFRRDPNADRKLTSTEFDAPQDQDDLPPEDLSDVDLLIRHDNAFGTAREDAIRRDFTINGLFYDVESDLVIDYVGGMEDVQARLLRTIGDPNVRFREDPVRILRAVKFCGKLHIKAEPLTFESMTQHKLELAKSAPPRVFEELLRLLRGGAAETTLRLAWETGVLGIIVPELAAFLDDHADGWDLVWKRMAALDRFVREQGVPSDSVLFSLLVTGPLLENMEGREDRGFAFEEFFDDMAQRLALPRRIKDRVRTLFAVQRRFETGKSAALAGRDYFDEALTLYTLECQARGEIPKPATASGGVYPDGKPRRKRRRRFPAPV